MMHAFTVPVRPVPKQRPRFGNGHAFTPRRTQDYERLVADCYTRSKGIKLDGALWVDIRFVFGIPKSWNKQEKERAKTVEVPYMAKPDVDNVIKSILDGLSGVAWNDDRQVTVLTAQKVYGTVEGTSIVIRNA